MGFKLNSGAVIPAIGFGVGINEVRTENAILTAIEIGYRHFDTAREYTTETVLGSALRKAFNSGLVRRQDVFITTKLSPADANPADVVGALQASLRDLQLEYVDLFLVHFPVRARKTVNGMSFQPGDLMVIETKELWAAMESCVDLGLATSIGVSNWSVKKLEELLAGARIPPAVNQVEVHPVWRQDKLRAYCKQKGIVVAAYSPLGAPNSVYGINDVITNPTINDVAKRNNKTPAQVILKWLLEKGVSFIVRSYDRSRLEQNFQVQRDGALAAADVELLDSITEQKKAVTGQMFIQPESGPFKTLQDLWDE